MKASYFWQHNRGTAACMKITMNDTKGCGQMSSNDTLIDNMWFNGVKTAEEDNAEVVDYFGRVKTSHKGFSWISWKFNERVSERISSC